MRLLWAFMHSSMLPDEGRNRIVIAHVSPLVEGGRFAIKRCVGEALLVRAQVFCDGHERPNCALAWRHETQEAPDASQVLMDDLGWDQWSAELTLARLGRYFFHIIGWVDHFRTWREDLEKRVLAAQDIEVDLQIGAQMLQAAAINARKARNSRDEKYLARHADHLLSPTLTQVERARLALDRELAARMTTWAERRFCTRTPDEFPIQVEPRRAQFSTWYEFFPRSSLDPASPPSPETAAPQAPQTGAPQASTPAAAHATLRDAIKRLDYVAEMGFDVVYLPPIHPIGRTNRKGRNNATRAASADVGSPWAIGSADGGHDAIHPQLGSRADLLALLEHARALGIDIALDIAFQASPDHPWVAEHPQWFKTRPDGTIQFAENPPKKYEDIFPFDFETAQWRELWLALEGVFRHWCDLGVRIFRVDNPHTKPFGFWEWLIANIQRDYPETIFLAEAFARPAVMHRLAKLGFSQSYTYFAWRNTRYELEEYLRELTQPPLIDFMRPNFWPNTPDILTEALQSGRRSTFMLRVALAATMSSNYGIYGPAYELMEHTAVRPGSEEYLDSEKYQLRHWNLEQPHSLKGFITRLNQIRNQNPALQQMRHTTIHHSENDQMMVFSKHSAAMDNYILVVANLDAEYTQATMLHLDLDALGVTAEQPFHVHDLIDDARYVWQGPRNYVELNPHRCPVHIFRIGRRIRDERDFDYY